MLFSATDVHKSQNFHEYSIYIYIYKGAGGGKGHTLQSGFSLYTSHRILNEGREGYRNKSKVLSFAMTEYPCIYSSGREASYHGLDCLAQPQQFKPESSTTATESQRAQPQQLKARELNHSN